MNKLYSLFSVLPLIYLLFLFPQITYSQEGSEGYSPEKLAEYKADVQNLVDFLEYSFNMLGNPKTTTRDKDVIINQSYAKIFRDGDVQIEDDLDDNREILINKDVQAYLKDIDFFFKEAVFSLNVSSVDHHFNADKDLYFIVTLTRTLNGRTVTGDSVSSNKERFIEVNYDDITQDLRIVSIYTTKIDEKDEMFAWWNKMPEAWRNVIGHEAFIIDTMRLSKIVEINDTMAIAEYWGIKEVPVDTFLVYGADTLYVDETEFIEGLFRDTLALRKNVSYRLLQRIASETEIDVSGNLNISSLAPLAQMGKIKKVNCANTLIDDLSPLRNLINIESLDCSGSAVSSLAPMQYSISLKSLDIHSTRVSDLEVIANLRNLEKFNFSNTLIDSPDMLSGMVNMHDLRFNNTFVSKLTAIQNLNELQIINCSRTYIKDLGPLQNLINLERLYISSTAVSSLQALSQLDMLQTIYLDSTNVNSLQPLNGLEKLEKVYCDNTGITGSKANKFMADNPNVLVVYESVALTKWWNAMSAEWQSIFRQMTELDTSPTKEQLHKAAKITEVDISGNTGIRNLAPLKTLTDLNILNCSNTVIDNLWPVSDLIDLNTLNCSGTGVSNCDPLRDLVNLEHLDISNTKITDIQCISRIKSLRELNVAYTSVTSINVFGKSNLNLVYADETGIGIGEVIAFKKENPDATVIYQSTDLQAWWAALSPVWQDIFTASAGIKHSPGIEDLQRIADLSEIDISQNKNLGNLIPLQKLYMLRSLKMNDTQISDLEPISGMHTLESLTISNNPIEDISAISGLTELNKLEFKNTPISDLRPLTGLSKLKILDMAGTQIKKLDEITSLHRLEQISFYNTSIKSLSPLEDLPMLRSIKCYNTRLSEKKVRKFGEAKPSCEIIFY
ncbi:MAG: hypothetical protein KAT76_02030 [Bacteroidales bacterium]|nr:hypothetical protein [Bacteroidales bacterium]